MRSIIKIVLLVANRLRSISTAHTPVLDQHLWMHVLRFVERSWWPAPALVDSGSDTDSDGDADGDINADSDGDATNSS